MKNQIEADAYQELKVLYASNLGEEVSYEVLEFAVISAAIRWRLKGVSSEFLETTIDEFSMADQLFL